MKPIRPKRPRLRLDPEPYDELRETSTAARWLEMPDLWFDARSAGPHKQLRSQQGDDDDLNLITLCASCHEKLHCSVDFWPRGHTQSGQIPLNSVLLCTCWM